MPDEKQTPRNLTDSVRAYFDSQGWQYRYDEEKGFFGMLVKVSEEMEACKAYTVIRDEERFTTFVTLPFRVPEEQRPLAARFISAANYQLLLGCFEMDFRDGDVQYKTTCLCGNVRLDPEHIRRYIEVGLQMARDCGPMLDDLIYKNVPLEDVLARLAKLRRDQKKR
ncbi:MAG: YbjN domain-containing protein [Oscillospiraceae bacterium]|nr:YbjN domain-containing protein [Oscillospiraceae bacterium]